jgi:biopolymer transport protein ExbD
VTGREWFRFGLFVVLVALIALAISRTKVSIKVDQPRAETAKTTS